MAMAPSTCPICDGPTPTEGPETKHRPFCSGRCKLVDLSRWLGEEYRVPGPMLGDGGAINLDGADLFDPLNHDNEEDLP